jgi:hypothetical protein
LLPQSTVFKHSLTKQCRMLPAKGRGRAGSADPKSIRHRHAQQCHDRTHVIRPYGRPYELPTWWAPNGFAAIPTTALDLPHRAASPAVPALIGSGSPSAAVLTRLHGGSARFTPQLFRSQQVSGIRLESHGDAARGSAPLAHCRAACQGNHWSAQGRGGPCRRTSRLS